MATVLTLGPSGSALNLMDRTAYKERVAEREGPVPEYEFKLTGRRGSDGAQPSYNDLRDLRFTFTLFCEGADAAASATNYGALAEQVRLASDYWLKGKGSVVQLTTGIGSQTAQVYDVLRGEIQPINHELAGKNHTVARLQLWCSPLAKAASNTTNTSATLTNFDTYNVTVGGTEPTYAKVRVKPVTSGADRVRVTALSSEGRTPGNHLYPLLPGAASPSGYSVSLKHAQRVAQVVLTIRAKGNTGQYKPVWRSGAGTNYAGDTQTLTDAGAYATYTHTYKRNPATDLPFTVAELNAGQWGVQKVGTTEVRVTQLYAVVTYVDRDLATQTVNRLPDADGATEQWTSTDGAVTYTAIDDAVGADDGDTTRLTSSTDAQISLVGLQDFTTLDAADSGVRAHVQGTGGFQNGGLEGSYSGPTLSAAVVTDTFDGTYTNEVAPGWSSALNESVSAREEGTIVVSGDAQAIGYDPSQSTRTLLFRTYGGLTVGTTYRLSIQMRTASGAPSGTGAVATIITGARNVELTESGTSYTAKTLDFVAVAASVTVTIRNTGTSTAYFDDLTIKTIQSYAANWSATGSITGAPSADPKHEGTYAQIVGAGDTSNYVGQAIVVPSAVQYRVTARLMSKYSPQGTAVAATLRLVSGANSLVLSSTSASQFEEVSGVITTDGNALTFQAYGASGGEMFLDAVTFGRVDGSDVTGNEMARFTITSNLTDHYGVHKVFAAVKVTGASANLALRYGGTDGQLIARNAVTVETSTTITLVEVGQLSIPESNTPAGTALTSFKFSLYVAPSAASNAVTTVDIDSVILWPVTENHVMSKPGTALGPAVNEYQVFDGLASPQAVYVADTSGNKTRSTPYEGRYVQLRPGVNRVFCLVARTATDFRRGDQFVLEITHVDRGVV